MVDYLSLMVASFISFHRLSQEECQKEWLILYRGNSGYSDFMLKVSVDS